MSFPPEPLREVAQDVATLLKDRGETISVVETASGGLISATLLSLPGASSYYSGGTTLYTLPSRLAFGGWTDADTQNYRGPTPEVVAKLARHTRETLGSTWCIGESGTAGPTGGSTRNRTPGYVALAVVGADGKFWVEEVETGSGERGENMVQFALGGLRLLRKVLRGEAERDGKL